MTDRDRLEVFVALVEAMRHHQQNYFRRRTAEDLAASKRAEAAVDVWLRAYREPPGLFDGREHEDRG